MPLCLRNKQVGRINQSTCYGCPNMLCIGEKEENKHIPNAIGEARTFIKRFPLV